MSYDRSKPSDHVLEQAIELAKLAKNGTTYENNNVHVNTSLLEEFACPSFESNIDIDSGENAIVQYAFTIKSSHVDIIGYRTRKR